MLEVTTRKGSVLPIAVMAFAIVAFLFVMDWAVNPHQRWPWSTTSASKNTNIVACTQEAKLCPDGSYVGRTGRDCAFATCPSVNANMSINSSNYNTNSPELTPQEDKNNANSNTNESVSCGDAAYRCPDGSFVFEVPPTCHFAACPGT